MGLVTANTVGLSGLVAPKPDVQIFTTSGTWTKPPGCSRVYMELVGGGGGAGAVGLNGSGHTGGAGGAGLSSSITGASVARGGGGGAAGDSGAGSGGTGGGGAGAVGGTATAGTANTGGGGGAGGGNGANGGSGIVIVRMATSDYSGTQSGGTVTTDGSDTIITWLSSGTFTG